MPGASTDANITLRLYYGGGPRQELELSCDKNDFRRGVLNEFLVMMEERDVQSASMGHDNTGTALHVCRHLAIATSSSTHVIVVCRLVTGLVFGEGGGAEAVARARVCGTSCCVLSSALD